MKSRNTENVASGTNKTSETKRQSLTGKKDLYDSTDFAQKKIA